MGPLFLWMKIDPQMTSATTSVMSFLSSSSNCVNYALDNEIPWSIAGECRNLYPPHKIFLQFYLPTSRLSFCVRGVRWICWKTVCYQGCEEVQATQPHSLCTRRLQQRICIALLSMKFKYQAVFVSSIRPLILLPFSFDKQYAYRSVSLVLFTSSVGTLLLSCLLILWDLLSQTDEINLDFGSPCD